MSNMSPTIQPNPTAICVPISDVVDRHEYGVSKNRKQASAGGGRAWSDDEEVYLLQTRLQKMPYKHIAAHLKKTELACRLHYHQLSHGSNRRKRTTSASSGSTSGRSPPLLPTIIPSPIHEHIPWRTPSPPGQGTLENSYIHKNTHYPVSAGGLQLPSILGSNSGSKTISSSSSSNAPGADSDGDTNSPRLPAIFPKPGSMTLAKTASSAAHNAFGMTESNISISQPHNAPLLPSATFTTITTPSSANATDPSHSASVLASSSSTHSTPSLRLDCTMLPPLPPLSASPHHPVDMGRLNAVYSVHRTAFWNMIATDYGHGSHPVVLEQAWRSGNTSVMATAGSTATPHPHPPHVVQTATPLTPSASPEDRDVLFYGVKSSQQSQDKTRIAAILGIDANPRSPKEREMVRRLEEGRVTGPAAA